MRQLLAPSINNKILVELPIAATGAVGTGVTKARDSKKME
jgi:hypothetical protein